LSKLVQGKGEVVATSLLDVLEEYFTTELHPDARMEG